MDLDVLKANGDEGICRRDLALDADYPYNQNIMLLDQNL
jgi:hypothetical protein